MHDNGSKTQYSSSENADRGKPWSESAAVAGSLVGSAAGSVAGSVVGSKVGSVVGSVVGSGYRWSAGSVAGGRLQMSGDSWQLDVGEGHSTPLEFEGIHASALSVS